MAQSGTTGDATSTAPPPAGHGFDVVDTITTAHFLLIAALIVLVMIGIVYGVRQKRLRRQAEKDELDRMDALGAACAAEPQAPRSPAPAPLSAAARQPPAPPPQPAAVDGPAASPVSQIKGLGPKVTALLAERGITSVGQIAALSDDEAEALDAQLGPFQGRLTRERWVEQARFLAQGDKAGFEAVFGRL